MTQKERTMFDDAIHGPLTLMSADAAKAFPNADYVIAVTMPPPQDAQGKPTVHVHASQSFKTVSTTNLQGLGLIPKTGNGFEYKFLPGADEMLKLVHSDATVAYCVNRPTWRWVSLIFTKQS
jgi:hypothetical protein